MKRGGGGGCVVSWHRAATWAMSWHDGSCTRMSGTCVIRSTCAGCATITRRRGGGVIGCAATRVVTWVSSIDQKLANIDKECVPMNKMSVPTNIKIIPLVRMFVTIDNGHVLFWEWTFCPLRQTFCLC